jgi:chromosome segregation ATPase
MKENAQNSKKSKAPATEDGALELATALTAPDASLETVRDILFGAQIRDTHQQREALAQQLKSAIDELSQDADKRFERLHTDLQTMRKELDQNSVQQADSFNKQLHSLDQSLQELGKATSSAEAELADQIDSNVRELNSQMDNWKEQLSEQLDQVHAQLMHDKTDRGTLADLFAGLSEQLMSDSTSKK